MPFQEGSLIPHCTLSLLATLFPRALNIYYDTKHSLEDEAGGTSEKATSLTPKIDATRER